MRKSKDGFIDTEQIVVEILNAETKIEDLNLLNLNIKIDLRKQLEKTFQLFKELNLNYMKLRSYYFKLENTSK